MNNPKAEAVRAALHALDGVDDKLLKRPEITHLPSVLEDDELPASLVRGSNLSVAVATDRRIVVLHQSLMGSSVKKAESFRYSEIESITAGKGFLDAPLEVVIAGKARRLEADKSQRYTFAEFVAGKLASSKVDKDQDVLKSTEQGESTEDVGRRNVRTRIGCGGLVLLFAGAILMLVIFVIVPGRDSEGPTGPGASFPSASISPYEQWEAIYLSAATMVSENIGQAILDESRGERRRQAASSCSWLFNTLPDLQSLRVTSWAEARAFPSYAHSSGVTDVGLYATTESPEVCFEDDEIRRSAFGDDDVSFTREPVPVSETVVVPLEFTPEQVSEIDQELNEHMLTWRNRASPLRPDDYVTICRDWQKVDWLQAYVGGGDGHHELPQMIRDVTGLPNAVRATNMVAGYCAHKLGDVSTSPILVEPGLGNGSREHPVPLGTPAEVRFSDSDYWEITVISVLPDATNAVLSYDHYNDPPVHGNQFFMATIRAKYLGTGSTYFDGGFRLRTLGLGGVAYTTFDNSCGVIPNELPDPELFTSGTIGGAVCWNIASSDADSLVLMVGAAFLSEQGRAWFGLYHAGEDNK